ncbi:hypothetical protein [Burkholderia cepacia]|uniref:hypothetical protein n=1 Tax=Burkholderia cepacia TaxID=292 RepID=UPI0012D45B37|nr:hypothetical protein [Burkholderia cepacia]
MKPKTDARKRDQSTQAHLRKMVVQAVRDAMTQVDVARTYGVSPRAVSNQQSKTILANISRIPADSH